MTQKIILIATVRPFNLNWFVGENSRKTNPNVNFTTTVYNDMIIVVNFYNN